MALQAGFLFVAGWLAIEDVRRHQVGYLGLLGMMALAGAIAVLAAPEPILYQWHGWPAHVTAAVVIGTVLGLAWHLTSGKQIGDADVVYASALGLALGPDAVFAIIIAALLTLMWRGRAHAWFPHLLAGGLVVWLLQLGGGWRS